MPSPFPGMDPYLEDPAVWPGVHQGLITYAQSALNALLPSGYAANVNERVYIVEPDRIIVPDVAVLQHAAPDAGRTGRDGGTATAIAGAPPWVVTYHPVEMREVFIEIIPVRGERRVITVIEVLSPSNKTTGSEGRELYLTKQREILMSQTHLVEIDLLRQGEHTIAASRKELLKCGRWDYLVCLHRGGQGNRFEAWPVSLRDRLPEVRVPLSHGDPDVILDLQAVFQRCYEEGGFARWMDYEKDPEIALGPDDAAWAKELVRGARSP